MDLSKEGGSCCLINLFKISVASKEKSWVELWSSGYDYNLITTLFAIKTIRKLIILAESISFIYFLYKANALNS